jgi:hypothetical protein
MLLCCKKCDAFIGLVEPIASGIESRTGLCKSCLEKRFGKATTDFLNDTATDVFTDTTDHGPLGDSSPPLPGDKNADA